MDIIVPFAVLGPVTNRVLVGVVGMIGELFSQNMLCYYDLILDISTFFTGKKMYTGFIPYHTHQPVY